MRIDILNNMKAIIQSEKRRSTRRWIIFAGIIIGAGYLFILVSTYVLKPRGDASDQVAVNQYEGSVIRVDAFVAPGPSKHASGRTVAVYHTDYRPAGLIHHEVAPVNPTAAQNSNASNSQAIKVYTTSSAKARNLGAGISGGSGGAGTTVHVSSAVPFSTSTSSMVMSTAVWTSSRSLSAKNTLAAEQQLLADNSVENTGGRGEIRKVGGKPLDPFMDPIGDGLWALFITAVVYAGAVLIRRRKQQA